MACFEPVRGFIVAGPDGRRRVCFRGVPPPGAKSISVPCGYCIGCVLESARQWAVRILHEAKTHEDNSFITLTFDEANLPPDGSLSVKTAQKFLKRLRKRIAEVACECSTTKCGRVSCPSRKIRFFLAGEYGEKLGRPHYHAIVFGWSFPDKVYFKGTGELSLFTSPLLSQSWGFGFASVGQVSFDSALYVANYATKKIRTNREEDARRLNGRAPEFRIMSRGGRAKGEGGIGHAWITKWAGDVYPSDEVIVRGVSTRPPRYYDQVVGRRDPEGLARVKARRESTAERLEEVMLQSGDTIFLPASRNARRLKQMEAVARAKFALKSRKLESETHGS